MDIEECPLTFINKEDWPSAQEALNKLSEMPLQQRFQGQQETMNDSPVEGSILTLEGQSISHISEQNPILDRLDCKLLNHFMLPSACHRRETVVIEVKGLLIKNLQIQLLDLQLRSALPSGTVDPYQMRERFSPSKICLYSF